MIYNLRKFQVLNAIEECNQKNIYATCGLLEDVLCANHSAISMCLTRCFDYGYVSRKRIPGMRGQVYSLTKKGMNALSKYTERFMQGSHMNLKYKPYEVDYSNFTLMPVSLDVEGVEAQ